MKAEIYTNDLTKQNFTLVFKLDEDNDETPNSDVNLIFGLAIFHTRKKKIHQQKHYEENTREAILLGKEIKFLSEMRTYISEVILSEVYLEKCYDSFLRSSNRGYMTLVSEEYFDFGLRLMKKIANSLTQDVIKSELGVTKKAKQSLFRDNDLKQMFMNCCKDSNHLEKKQEKEKMYQELVNKTANAKYSDEFRAYREAHTVRG